MKEEIKEIFTNNEYLALRFWIVFSFVICVFGILNGVSKTWLPWEGNSTSTMENWRHWLFR